LSHEEEFPYGWRLVRRGDALVEVPLTLEDVLHPQLDDTIPQNTLHCDDCHYLLGAFRGCPLSPGFALVTHDLIINWGVPGIRNHCPDLAVFVGLSRDPGCIGTLDLASLGGRCELVVEVVEPKTRINEVVAKFDHYHRVGVPLYAIIDQEREEGPRSVRAYRHAPGGYVEVAPDDQGRVALPPLGLLLGLREEQAVCYEAATGERVLSYAELYRETERLEEQLAWRREEAARALAKLVAARREAERRAAEAEANLQAALAKREAAKAYLRTVRTEREASAAKAERLDKEVEQRLRKLQEARRGRPPDGTADATCPLT
jgi:hypothetical protein